MAQNALVLEQKSKISLTFHMFIIEAHVTEAFAAASIPKISSGFIWRDTKSVTVKRYVQSRDGRNSKTCEKVCLLQNSILGNHIWVFNVDIDFLGANASEAPTSLDWVGWIWPKSSIRGIFHRLIIGMEVSDADIPENLLFLSSRPKYSVLLPVYWDLKIRLFPKIMHIFFRMYEIRLLREKVSATRDMQILFSVLYCILAKTDKACSLSKSSPRKISQWKTEWVRHTRSSPSLF